MRLKTDFGGLGTARKRGARDGTSLRAPLAMPLIGDYKSPRLQLRSYIPSRRMPDYDASIANGSVLEVKSRQGNVSRSTRFAMNPFYEPGSLRDQNWSWPNVTPER